MDKLDTVIAGGVYQKGNTLVNAAGEVVGEVGKPKAKATPAPEAKPVEEKPKKAKDE